MNNIKKILLFGLGIFVILVIVILAIPSSDKKDETQTGQNLPNVSPVVSNRATVKATQKPQVSGKYSVVKVVDGDTVDLNINGKVERIRLIGMNTPETVDPRKPVECFGKEASNRAKELLTGKVVKIEYDPAGNTRDKYDRLLLYIFLADGTNYAKKMIMDGYAYEYTYDVKYKYQSEFKQAQKYAEDNKLGLCSEQNQRSPATLKSFSFSPKKALSNPMRAARSAPRADLFQFAFSQLAVCV